MPAPSSFLLPLERPLELDPLLTLASFGIGIVVGLTGMGGGALMTPVLVLFFHIPPLTAVSSDLVASAIMKPVGSVVHLRRDHDVRLVSLRRRCSGRRLRADRRMPAVRCVD